jgi:hypothetical protein
MEDPIDNKCNSTAMIWLVICCNGGVRRGVRGDPLGLATNAI